MVFQKETTIRGKDPRELFDRGLALFVRGLPENSVAVLREAFFGNLYIAPVLLGIPVAHEKFWVPGPSGTYEAAREYCRKQRKAWQDAPNALRYLRCLWNDPLVRREIRSYWNFCKSYARSQGASRVTRELIGENAKFTNPRRIQCTQQEILTRIRQYRFDLPPSPPRVAALTVVTEAAAALADFIRDVLGFSPVAKDNMPAWTFSFQDVELTVVAGDASYAGIEICLTVSNFEYYMMRLEDKEIVPVDMQKDALRGRYILLEAPGGIYLKLLG